MSFLADYEVTDFYGIDGLGLGQWKYCEYWDREDLPPTRSVYLLTEGFRCASADGDVLYVGIAPESLRSRWITAALRGGHGHHVVERIPNYDQVEYSPMDPEDTFIAYCEVPNMSVVELERVEECLIDLLIPRLNRQKSPLHPFKTAFRELHRFAADHGWSEDCSEWPPSALALHRSIADHLSAFRFAQMEQAPQWMTGLRGRWNYRAVVPGFAFLPREWRVNMRYCPTHIIRLHLLRTFARLTLP